MITLYQLERCPWCAAVRQALSNVGVEARLVEVPRARERRDEVERLSGQRLVPTLVDHEHGVVVWDSRRVVRYLYERFGGDERADSARELPETAGGMRPLPAAEGATPR